MLRDFALNGRILCPSAMRIRLRSLAKNPRSRRHSILHTGRMKMRVPDLSMPHMSGFDLAREMLALRPEIPMLMTTGNICIEETHYAREVGIREVILKPVTVGELAHVPDQILRGGDVTGEPSAETDSAICASGRNDGLSCYAANSDARPTMRKCRSTMNATCRP